MAHANPPKAVIWGRKRRRSTWASLRDRAGVRVLDVARISPLTR